MKRTLAACALLLVTVLAWTPQAQGRVWVLVNGALQYTGTVIVNGIFSLGTTANQTIVVASSGGDYTDIQSAFDGIRGRLYSSRANVTIQVNDGTYALSSPIVPDHPQGAYISVQGQHTYAKTVSSIQSSSGSAGAWSIILNIDSVTNIAVNDYVAVPSPTGGTLPSYLAGVFKVTNVDAVNTRITITSTHKNASAPSGAVTGALTVFKTIISCPGIDGIRVWNRNALSVDNLVFVGDGTGGANGLSVQDVSRLYIATIVGVVGFGGYNVFSLYNSEINGTTLLASGGAYGFEASDGGVININTAVVSGGSQQGMEALLSGNIKPTTAIATGFSINGFQAGSGGAIVPVTATATGSGGQGAVTIDSSAFIDVSGLTASTNAGGTYLYASPGGLSIGYAARLKVFNFTTSSPYDQLTVTSNGSTGGWQGTIDLNANYNSGTNRTGLRVVADTNGTSAAAVAPFALRLGANSGVLVVSATAPTVTSAGSSPSVTASNGTAAFRVNVGTGGTATTIVMAMPTATTGWSCQGTNLTAAAANVADQAIREQSSTTAAVTLQYQTVSTGAAKAFTASDIVDVHCLAF